ncbi:uncharacterized protein EI97DRAFT_434916 [Westerdykella ornata]|uniref:Uncharacterized protein n=1 Tax=Westerdykella ornata TaxID=318751 RepID=A0A6A6JDP7_WESOR|nr:uncharacterized protein EI97DRAFT_434916 [Westerdykella ornata]KAF2274681.1 hypothetical protein EI97DRAFT_434916 [Westerdykella ornata]
MSGLLLGAISLGIDAARLLGKFAQLWEDSNASCAQPVPSLSQPRKVTPHMRKLFLVAERLTWDYAVVSSREREQNEQLTWEVNYELGILEPFVEDAEQVPGGKKSRLNKWYPYQNQHEMKLAMSLISMDAGLTEVSWSLWYGLQMNIQRVLGHEEDVSNRNNSAPRDYAVSEERSGLNTGMDTRSDGVFEFDVTRSPDDALFDTSTIVPDVGIPTPPSSSSNPSKETTRPATDAMSSSKSIHPALATRIAAGPTVERQVPCSNDDKRIISYKTLQDFYSLLEQIERTSYLGALFLEAYAEHLRDDACRDCWLKHNIVGEAK